MKLNEICSQVIDIAKETGDYIRKERLSFTPEMIKSKGVHNYVSHVDKNAEKMLVERLSKLIPDSGFIAEEGTGKRNTGGFNWVIDPLDGTTNFIHGLPPYSVSLALTEGDQVMLGVVYEINLNECFYSWQGAPAYLNGGEISVSNTGKVTDSLIATGFPYTDFSQMGPFIDSFKFFMENSHGLRRLGSAAVDLSYVACGRFDAFYEYGLNAWDVAAGAFIVLQAGGKVGDFAGGDDYIFGGELVAANSYIYDEFLAQVKQFMNP